MKRVMLGIATIVLITLTGCGLQDDLSATGGTVKVTPTAAPAVTGQTVGGTRFNLGSLRGEPVVVDFFGSWCGPCRAEQPSLNQIATAYERKGVHFIGIAMRDDATAVAGYEHDYAIPYPAVVDSDGSFAADYDVNAPPTAIVINRYGQIVAKYLATTQGMEDELNQVLRG